MILLMEDIPNNHLGWSSNLVKYGIPYLSTGGCRISSINGSSPLVKGEDLSALIAAWGFGWLLGRSPFLGDGWDPVVVRLRPSTLEEWVFRGFLGFLGYFEKHETPPKT